LKQKQSMNRLAVSAMNARTRIASCIIGLALSTAVGASAVSARIERILIFEDGNLVYVWPVGGLPNPPGCHGSNGNYYSFSLNRPRAKEYLAGLLSAQAQGATVAFYGTGTCQDQSVSETLSYFAIIS
jgi:hypothetical protein